MSSAVSDWCSGLLGTKPGDSRGWLELSKKGFRETGLCRVAGSSKGDVVGDARAGSRPAGDAARLRKGLFEDKLTDSPGDGRRPMIFKILVIYFLFYFFAREIMSAGFRLDRPA